MKFDTRTLTTFDRTFFGDMNADPLAPTIFPSAYVADNASVLILFAYGAFNTVVGPFLGNYLLTLQDSEDNVNFTDVDPSNILGQQFIEIIDNFAPPCIAPLGYLGKKAYVRLVVTPPANGDSSLNTAIVTTILNQTGLSPNKYFEVK